MVGIRKFIVDFETTGSKKLLEKLLFNSTRGEIFVHLSFQSYDLA